MTLRELNDKQIEELRLLCERDLEASKYMADDVKKQALYKKAWSDGAKQILSRLDYLPDAKP